MKAIQEVKKYYANSNINSFNQITQAPGELVTVAKYYISDKKEEKTGIVIQENNEEKPIYLNIIEDRCGYDFILEYYLKQITKCCNISYQYDWIAFGGGWDVAKVF